MWSYKGEEDFCSCFCTFYLVAFSCRVLTFPSTVEDTVLLYYLRCLCIFVISMIFQKYVTYLSIPVNVYGFILWFS